MKKLVILTLLFTGCTNAQVAKFSALGKPHIIKCYSGGVLVYEGVSTGSVKSEHNSDGYYFQDDKTGNLVTVNANCVITVETK